MSAQRFEMNVEARPRAKSSFNGKKVRRSELIL